MKKILSLLLAVSASQLLTAQNSINTQDAESRKKGKVYLSTNFDTYLLTSSLLSSPRVDNKWTTPRFTAFLHIGLNANYDFTSKVGIMAGLNTRNLGFIEKMDNPSYTIIRRVYTFGIPVALKIGNLEGNRTFFIIGGGVDFPFNYREKGFSKRNPKDYKFNEWFSNRTQQVLPYVFVGARFNPGVYVKLQYYPSNMMNTNYTTTLGGMTTKPYANYKVSTTMLSLGFDIKYTPKY